MKKLSIIMSCVFLVLFSTSCSDNSKEEELNKEITALNQDLDDLQAEYDDYKEEMEPYEELAEKELKLKEKEAAKELEEIEAKEKEKEEAEKLEKEKKEKKEKEEQEKEEKAGYETGITYDKLARNPDDFIDKKVKFKGKVTQVMEGDGLIQLRFAVDDNYDNMLYLEYDSSIVSSRILEDDYITIYGLSKGLITYQSTMGGDITIPAVVVDKIDQND